MGLLETRLHFIRNCKTPFLGWVDSTDFILPDTIQKCRSCLFNQENSKYSGIFTGIANLPIDTVYTDLTDTYSSPYKDYTLTEHLAGNITPTPFMLFRTKAVKQALTILPKFFSARAYTDMLISGYVLDSGPWLQFPDTLYIKREISHPWDFEKTEALRSTILDHLRSRIQGISETNPVTRL